MRRRSPDSARMPRPLPTIVERGGRRGVIHGAAYRAHAVERPERFTAVGRRRRGSPRFHPRQRGRTRACRGRVDQAHEDAERRAYADGGRAADLRVWIARQTPHERMQRHQAAFAGQPGLIDDGKGSVFPDNGSKQGAAPLLASRLCYLTRPPIQTGDGLRVLSFFRFNGLRLDLPRWRRMNYVETAWDCLLVAAIGGVAAAWAQRAMPDRSGRRCAIRYTSGSRAANSVGWPVWAVAVLNGAIYGGFGDGVRVVGAGDRFGNFPGAPRSMSSGCA